MSTTRIPLFAPWIAPAATRYVVDCLESGWISSVGPYVSRFERAFGTYCGATHALAVSSGTAALHLALAARGVGPGDEVILPALTFVATANAITYTGARPVFVDVDPDTWTLAPADVERKLSSRTRAIVAVHLYGHPADMDPLRELARARKALLVEDAAEAHGARYRGQMVGALGDIGCFSFFGNKLLSTGEGGMVLTNDAELADVAGSLRGHAPGRDRASRYDHPHVGYNYRMTSLQAALGCAQLEDLDSVVRQQRATSERYRARLGTIAGITLPPHAPWAEPITWLFSVLLPTAAARDATEAALEGAGIETRPFFVPLHKLVPYATGARHPVAEDIAARGLSLPSSPTITAAEIDRVCETVRASA
jgi:perosamine synthetase